MEIMAGIFLSIYERDRPLRIGDRRELERSPNVAIRLGDAPDGLPLILNIERRASVEGAVVSALGKARRSDLSPPINTALERLESAAREEACRAGIEKVDGRLCYVTHAQASTLLGDTMMSRVLGAVSPLWLKEDHGAPSAEPEQTPITAAIAAAEKPKDVMEEVSARRHLAIVLADSTAHICRRAKDKLVSSRPLEFETMAPFRPRFRIDVEANRQEGDLGDVKRYHKTIADGRYVAWSVSRAEVGKALCAVARQLGRLHQSGVVHGDVKPANVLISPSGEKAIDPVGLTAGQVSPAATAGWAAPEQVLARPVSPATDVYPLGLMAICLVQGAIYGEERIFVVPVGGSARRRLRIMYTPSVFVDPLVSELDNAGIKAWQEFLARCLAFEPEKRPADGLQFADRLEEILEGHPLPGRVAFRGGPGYLTRNTEVDGRLQPSWVLTDAR